VRVIAEDGAQLGILTIEEARAVADERGFDLVEVSPDADPPVCRLLDYGKFKYQQKKKVQEAKKKQHVVRIKELRLRPITEEHDVETKIKHARQFLEDGDKVMVDMIFKGRQMAHKDIGRQIVDRVVKALEDIAKIEAPLSMQGTHMNVTLAPRNPPA